MSLKNISQQTIAELKALCPKNISLDSRAVKPGTVFCALAGTAVDGHDYIQAAVDNGAIAIIAERAVATTSVPLFVEPHLKQGLGTLAELIYPIEWTSLALIAVTGTNGKTTVTHLITQILGQLNYAAGFVGTLGYGTLNETNQTNYTTPDVFRCYEIIHELQAKGITHITMEVSSHALAQARVQGLKFATAIFTNLSHDHLDFHGTMEAYFLAKQGLFFEYPCKNSVINIDDEWGEKLYHALQKNSRMATNAITVGRQADFSLTHYQSNFEYAKWQIRLQEQSYPVQTTLIGEYNAMNLTQAIAAILSLNISMNKILPVLQDLEPVCGRMERIFKRGFPLVVVDYAHTPDALARALACLQELIQPKQKLFCIFGCGGERDKAKRPLMGTIASRIADVVIVTNDNPRQENPENIAQEIIAGIEGEFRWEPCRRTAIADTLTQASVDDIILIAGKGHEDYQILGTEKIAFSDQAIVRELQEEAYV